MATLVTLSPLPPGHTRIKTVGSLHELVTTPFADGINALCWPRVLPGNFPEILEALSAGEGIVPVDEDQLAALTLSGAGKIARDVLLADLTSLRAYDLQPEFDCVYGSERQESTSPTHRAPQKSPPAARPVSAEQAHTDELTCQLKSIGKLAVSRKQAQQLLPYSARTFRRLELRNQLPRDKNTRRVVYAVSDLIKLIEEGKKP